MIGVGYSEDGSVRPPARQIRQFFLQLRFASRSASFQQALQALQIPAGRIVHGNFNAALKSDVADPHKNAEGSRQHHEIERGELGTDGHVHESVASPIE